MPLPTTSLNFSAIQTEFGGANPISLSEYYKGSLYVPTNQATSATDGTAIAISGGIRFGMFRGLTKSLSGGAVSAFGGNMTGSQFGGTVTTTASVTVIMWPDGTFTGGFTGNVGGVNSAAGDVWYNPVTAGIGNSHWVRATVTGSVLTSGTINVWTQLSVNQSWVLRTAASAFSFKSSTLVLDVSSSASGSPIVASGSFSLQADKES